jgi:hypothetical protein
MRSRLLGTAIAAAMAILPVVPPEHVHVIEEHGHHEVTVHRHAPLHAVERHGGATPLKFDHTDEPILTLALIYRAPAPVVIAAPPTTAFAWLNPPQTTPLVVAVDVERVIHGPPRASTSLRAPPAFPFL